VTTATAPGSIAAPGRTTRVRRLLDLGFQVLALIVLLAALAALGVLIADIVADGAGRLGSGRCLPRARR
jgi:hypothetical protein